MNKRSKYGTMKNSKPQDKISIDSRILTKLEELADESEKKVRKGGKELGMSIRRIADDLECSWVTVEDRLNNFTILQNMNIKINIIEDIKGNTMIFVRRENLLIAEELSLINKKLEFLLKKNGL